MESISPGAILDWIYCHRRWYLRYMEGSAEQISVPFIEGQSLHEDVDRSQIIYDNGCFWVTNVALVDRTHGIYGIADMVQCVPSDDGVEVPWLDGGTYDLIPVELKHGKLRDCAEYRAQIVAYALCLEDMFHMTVQVGRILFDNTDTLKFQIDDRGRNVVLSAVSDIRAAAASRFFVRPAFGRKCYHCVMREQCDAKNTRINEYMEQFWMEV